MGIFRSIRALAAALAIACLLTACEGGGDEPAGRVILTASGNIGKTNRGPYDDKRDVLFKYHELSFQKAFEFDEGMLLLLDQERVRVETPETGKPVTLQGPTLDSVLQALGVEKPQLIRFLALDGYATEIDAKAIGAKDWVVAVTLDGRPMEIGQFGPVWVVYRPENPPHADPDEEPSWPWAVFYMEVQ